MKWQLIFFLLPLTCTYSLAQQPTPEQIKQVKQAKKEVQKMEGSPFPTFELQTITGEVYTNENLKGKVFLFNFWFTSCRPCVEELPAINELVQEFKKEGVVFIAPTFEELPKVEKFINRFEFKYEPVADVKGFVLSNNVRSFPTHFVIDKKGYVQKVMTGYSDLTANALRKAINKLLK